MPAGLAAAAEPPKINPGLVVHEWGTFSTLADANGNYRKFHVTGGDLPKFVYQNHYWDNTKAGRGAILVSLETPVLYFYSDREITASVRVDFPEGVMTDWYPQASRPPDHKLMWDKIKVFPRGQDVPMPPQEKDANPRYFHARAVDASPVQIVGKKEKIEHEKFLFYRGVGDCQMPLKVQALGNGIFTIANTGKEAIPAFVLMENRGGKIRFRQHGHRSPRTAMKTALPAEEATREALAETVTQLLVDQGLYPKEASAMVKTWQADWFGDEGTRVLYLVPSAVTDEFLPIRITPKPESLVRVLVGRHDVMTPEVEQKLFELMKKYDEYHNELGKLGRYAEAVELATRERLQKAYQAQQKK
jgi:hypothetical protein